MKLIKPSFSILPQSDGLEGIYRQIEMAGRTCYKSEDKITETSAKEFVDRMIKSGHGAMLEHGTVYLTIPNDNDLCLLLKMNPYTKCNPVEGTCYITTNLRVLVEHKAMWLIDKYLCEPTEYHERRYTVKFICDRGVSHEFVRHRVFSFAQESTRYCNYSKDKFGNELTFIIPCWLDIPEGGYECFEDSCEIEDFKAYALDSDNRCFYGDDSKDLCLFLRQIDNSEYHYLKLLDKGWKPQQARAILPNSLKTELVMTGFVSDWKHFFELRCAGAAHPQARELAIPLREEFINKGYI